MTKLFLERYRSQDDLDKLKYAIHGALQYCKMHRLDVETTRNVLEVSAMSALPDYDCFDSDWLIDVLDSQLKTMSREELFNYAVEWAVRW